MIIALHLVVENLGLAGPTGRDEVLVKHVEDVLTYVPQFLLNLKNLIYHNMEEANQLILKPSSVLLGPFSSCPSLT